MTSHGNEASSVPSDEINDEFDISQLPLIPTAKAIQCSIDIAAGKNNLPNIPADYTGRQFPESLPLSRKQNGEEISRDWLT